MSKDQSKICSSTIAEAQKGCVTITSLPCMVKIRKGLVFVSYVCDGLIRSIPLLLPEISSQPTPQRKKRDESYEKEFEYSRLPIKLRLIIGFRRLLKNVVKMRKPVVINCHEDDYEPVNEMIKIIAKDLDFAYKFSVYENVNFRKKGPKYHIGIDNNGLNFICETDAKPSHGYYFEDNVEFESERDIFVAARTKELEALKKYKPEKDVDRDIKESTRCAGVGVKQCGEYSDCKISERRGRKICVDKDY